RNRSTLRLMRSSRLSSGLRRKPAVMTTTLLVATSSIVPAVMRWSATRLAPCNRSVAWANAVSLLASVRQRRLTTPPHWSAYPVMVRLRPSPPMMLTFMRFTREIRRRRFAGASRLHVQGCHHLVGDRLHQRFEVRHRSSVAVAARLRLALARRHGLGVTAAEGVVRAQVTVFAAVEADIVVTKPPLEGQHL